MLCIHDMSLLVETGVMPPMLPPVVADEHAAKPMSERESIGTAPNRAALMRLGEDIGIPVMMRVGTAELVLLSFRQAERLDEHLLHALDLGELIDLDVLCELRGEDILRSAV